MKNNLFRSQKPKNKKRVFCRNIIICLKIRKNYSPINIILSVEFSEKKGLKTALSACQTTVFGTAGSAISIPPFPRRPPPSTPPRKHKNRTRNLPEPYHTLLR